MPHQKMSKRTLSVIIMTYNEAHRLPSCLESVAWADDVIVVDGYSTDDTADVARKYTPHVYLSDLLGPKNPGGFSDQRNFGLSKATGDWVFFLDADERVTPELRAEIEARLLEGPEEGHSIYRLRRREHFFGVPSPYTHGESWLDRIVRRGAAVWDGRLVHEGLTYEGTRGDLLAYFLHYSKDTVAQYVETMNRYTSLEAEEAFKKGTPLARTPWRAMFHAFFYRYGHMRSYREGTFGLLMCLMLTFYQYLTWAKHWEQCKDAGLVPGQTSAGTFTRATAGAIGGLWRGLGRIKRRPHTLSRAKG
jgi:glycosyltransferase involved in cell wall biosynthesis